MATVSNHKQQKGYLNKENFSFYTWLSKVQLIILYSALECTKNNMLRHLPKKVVDLWCRLPIAFEWFKSADEREPSSKKSSSGMRP